MRILFVTLRSHPPDQHAGAAKSAHQIVDGLRRRGHSCEAVAVLPPGRRLQLHRVLHRLSGRRWSGWRDRHNGYPTHRAAEWHVQSLLERRLREFRPDLVFTDHLGVVPLLPGGVRSLLRLADVEFHVPPTYLAARPEVSAFSNSNFTAGRVREHFGVDTPVLYPPIDLARYRIRRDAPRFVTLINPVETKGLEVAAAVARLLPHRPFLFVETWRLTGDRKRAYDAHTSGLDNVTLHPWTPDVRSVYAQTRVLLAPSLLEEAFGRVVLEAQASGIPVVASDIGGLPESVGRGGELLSPDAPAEAWARAVEGMLADEQRYRDLSEHARDNTMRPEFETDFIVDRFVELAERHVEAPVSTG